jgi:DNA-binding LacI/PurR family transcriptional regulator
MAVTLNDIAKAAGVSKATVSLALNRNERISRATVDKVLRVAAELNYVPDFRGKALAEKRTRMIGVVVPTIVSSFHSELVQAIRDRLGEEKYRVLLCITNESKDEEADYIDMFRGGTVDAAIFAVYSYVNSDGGNEKLISELSRNHIPVVYIDKEDPDDSIPTVTFSPINAVYQATKHLIDLGHRSICYVGYLYDSSDRIRGFKMAMEEAGITIDEESILLIPTFEGTAATDWLTKAVSLPTGLVCFNDEMAVGVVQSLTSAGIRVPDQVSVCGVDDSRFARLCSPSLTAIRVPIKEIGVKAAELSLKLLSGEKLSAEERYVTYPVELIPRESTAPPR